MPEELLLSILGNRIQYYLLKEQQIAMIRSYTLKYIKITILYPVVAV